MNLNENKTKFRIAHFSKQVSCLLQYIFLIPEHKTDVAHSDSECIKRIFFSSIICDSCGIHNQI